MTMSMANAQTVSLVVRRKIRAPVERIFEAWTRPEQLRVWWGPPHVKCPEAEVDLRVGGSYRIANALPDDSVLWITGEFEVVSPPRKLVYTWRLEPGPGTIERVTVRFEPGEDATEVIIVHERLANTATRDDHERGWLGCLDGLVAMLEA